MTIMGGLGCTVCVCRSFTKTRFWSGKRGVQESLREIPSGASTHIGCRSSFSTKSGETFANCLPETPFRRRPTNCGARSRRSAQTSPKASVGRPPPSVRRFFGDRARLVAREPNVVCRPQGLLAARQGRPTTEPALRTSPTSHRRPEMAERQTPEIATDLAVARVARLALASHSHWPRTRTGLALALASHSALASQSNSVSTLSSRTHRSDSNSPLMCEGWR